MLSLSCITGMWVLKSRRILTLVSRHWAIFICHDSGLMVAISLPKVSYNPMSLPMVKIPPVIIVCFGERLNPPELFWLDHLIVFRLPFLSLWKITIPSSRSLLILAMMSAVSAPFFCTSTTSIVGTAIFIVTVSLAVLLFWSVVIKSNCCLVAPVKNSHGMSMVPV